MRYPTADFRLTARQTQKIGDAVPNDAHKVSNQWK